MRLYLNDEEVTLAELKQEFDNLDHGSPDGGVYEAIELCDIDEDGNLHFEIIVGSTFG